MRIRHVPLCILILFVSFSVCAVTADSVWDGVVASSDVVSDNSEGRRPVRGTVFRDLNGSRFFLSHYAGDTAVFDTYWKSPAFQPGDELRKSHPIVSVRGFATTAFAGAQLDCSVIGVYPLQPFVLGGITYRRNILFDAGVKVSVPLSNISNIRNTLVRNGAFEVYSGAGTYGNRLSVIIGLDYRHAVRSFFWSAGGMYLSLPSTGGYAVIPRVSIGVAL